jgi:hypothetical protein
LWSLVGAIDLDDTDAGLRVAVQPPSPDEPAIVFLQSVEAC